MSFKKHIKRIPSKLALICVILRLALYKLFRHKITVINEAAGLGDYLWVQSFFPLLKEKLNTKIVFLSTARNIDFVKKYRDGMDVLISFEDPYHPSRFELIPLKIFQFDIFINFRADRRQYDKLSSCVRANKIINNFHGSGFYDERNNKTISQLVTLPANFFHTLHPYPYHFDLQNYIVFCPHGMSQQLSIEEITNIIKITLQEFPDQKILLLGTKSEKKLYKQLTGLFSNHLINGCNRFKQWMLPQIIATAEFVITVNTSIYHMSILTQKRVICFSNEAELKNSLKQNELNIHNVMRNDSAELKFKQILKNMKNILSNKDRIIG